jgi:hypothetical protein
MFLLLLLMSGLFVSKKNWYDRIILNSVWIRTSINSNILFLLHHKPFDIIGTTTLPVSYISLKRSYEKPFNSSEKFRGITATWSWWCNLNVECVRGILWCVCSCKTSTRSYQMQVELKHVTSSPLFAALCVSQQMLNTSREWFNTDTTPPCQCMATECSEGSRPFQGSYFLARVWKKVKLSL